MSNHTRETKQGMIPNGIILRLVTVCIKYLIYNHVQMCTCAVPVRTDGNDIMYMTYLGSGLRRDSAAHHANATQQHNPPACTFGSQGPQTGIHGAARSLWVPMVTASRTRLARAIVATHVIPALNRRPRMYHYATVATRRVQPC